ncbi:MAG: Bacterial sugar transferase [Bacteroidota bacterium]|jgi:lipopolysaccharide/colanic/teichoic acid biosynthesis glycosyltransferase
MYLCVVTEVCILKPDIICLVQISLRDDILRKKVNLEQEYLHKKSFIFDLEIIVKTFTNVLYSKDVSH